MKIILVGAGSRSFGRGQVVDVLTSEALRDRDVTLALVDIDEGALDLMMHFAERVKAHTGSVVKLQGTTDRREALPGADYVIVAVSRKRMPLWAQDFRLPVAYGFRHCLGENGGPGALFHAIRSLDLVIPICRDVEALAPDALVMNFTNPEARVLHAIRHLTNVKAAGFCHGVFEGIEALTHYLERPEEQLDIISAGMNHFYCILKAEDRETGEDLLPEAVRRAATDPDAEPLFRKMAEIFGVFTFPSDDHIGEYLAYGTEYSGAKWPFGIEGRPVPLEEPETPQLEDYASGSRPLDEWALRRSGELTVPVIADIERNRGAFRPAVNVLNAEGYIDNLPRSGPVEVPAVVDAEGLHPLMVGRLPETFAAFIRKQFTIIEVVTEAYRTRSRKLLFQALLLDPVVDSISGAEALLEDMLQLQENYLPPFE
jgi:alpha-galactosidase